MPGRKTQVPDTLKRSSAKALRTWVETHDNAVAEYGEGERAQRTAYAALKHTHEKVGDHWVAKDSKGPSDPRSKQPSAERRRGMGKTFGGVDAVGNSREELYRRARDLNVEGRSKMTKEELAEAIARRQ